MTKASIKKPNFYKRIWRDYLSHHKGKLVFALICSVFTAASTSGSALLMEPIFDELFGNKRQELIPIIMATFAGVFVIRGIASYGQSHFLTSASLSCIHQMQKHMLSSILKSDLQFLHDQGTARQLSKFTSDVVTLRQGIEQVMIGGKDIFTVIGLIGAMFYSNWFLAIFAFIFFPAVLIPVQKVGKRLRKISRQNQQEVAEITSILDDSFKNLRQVKAYTREEFENNRGETVFLRSKKLFYKAILTRVLATSIVDSMAGILIAVVIGIGAYMVFIQELTQGEFMAFISAALLAYQPVRSLTNLWSSIQVGMGAAERIFEVIDHNPTIIDAPNAKDLILNEGDIELRNVDFTYTLDNEKILSKLSLTAKSGQTVALVGPSGAGKSTILNLIPRFYDTQSGEVLIFGNNVKDLTLRSLRDKLGLVSQETGLFNDTIKNNILHGKPDASDEELYTAATAASAHDFILNLPNGYDTMVGEMGIKLSGGQRQRISIARAMLKNAPILLLDEATSALDTESERNVQSALEHLMEGRTTIVIAHRLSTIVNADKIYVLEKGSVVEEGSHNELLKLNGLYSKLHEMQKTSENVISLERELENATA
ncbi:ABC transporter ATP-binding protein [Curvivirga aplysinae]|uniref:ABC transporter ATP-binding protein n=1 Tax=Curvivirga aplysinae TaxID=2529852 RepID=UPI0012BC7D0D|nr:ABC transporter transmembrane domain-containing protein [Curvivirga aplysinae]MTI10835.1 ATP-binding cassette domain-containing protein [Curvivirga aplysinae]